MSARLSGYLSDGFCEGGRVIDAARNRERKRDDSEEEEKAQREAEEREIPVRMNAIDVHGDASVVLPAGQPGPAGNVSGDAVQWSLNSS